MLNKLLPKGSRTRQKLQAWYFNTHVPKAVTQNFIQLSDEKINHLKESLARNIYASAKAPDSPEVQQDSEELALRFQNHRVQIIPWLQSVRPLKGLRILEIGCGNGTSTVALAEQGAVVTAIDLEQGLLNDARERCATFGVSAVFHLMNATDVSTLLANEQYDMILFYAVLEHMTYAERLTAIRQTYGMLLPGGLWCVIGTPNRLHFYDSHTAMLPFFYWLPDELAMKYASFSSRPEFADRFGSNEEFTPEKELEFARWGRGVSYHEFELALGSLKKLNIVSSLAAYLKNRGIMYRIIKNRSVNGRFSSFLRKQYPTVHEGFFDPFLDIIIRKPPDFKE